MAINVLESCAGSHHSAAITVSGALMVFGRNKHGQVKLGCFVVVAVQHRLAMQPWSQTHDAHCQSVLVVCSHQPDLNNP